jgi:nucleoside-diphosphate-sugar epimerase
MRVFVLGGTGAIGGHAVPALVSAGHQVTALARSAEKAEALRRHGADAVLGTIFDRRALTRAFRGHDAVVNLASALPSTARFVLRRAWRENNRVRIDGSAAVAEAAAAAGVPRLLQESVSLLYPDRGDQWIDESVPPDEFPASRGNLAAEANTHRFTEAGGAGVVLRFGWFIGPGARHAEQFVALARRRIVVVLGRPDSYISSVHLDDAADAVVAALEAPAGIYNVVDDEPITKREFGEALASAVQRRPLRRLPGGAALRRGDRLTSLTRSMRVSNQRLRSATGWAPTYPSARDSWRATADALRQS